jgi:cyclopropane fatty-acyl-phospholipid synthase-like methyltransferase
MFNCPLSSEKANLLVEIIGLSPGSRVIDVGCGTGELLIRLIERYEVHGTGIDPDVVAISECRQKGQQRVAHHLLDLKQVEAAHFDWPEQLFDAALCVGSVHAFNGTVETLKQLKRRVVPGGVIVIGDIFWHKEPEPAYREIIGDEWPATDTDYLTWAKAGETEGLHLLYSIPSNQDEWDHFEGRFAARGYRRAYANSSTEIREAAINRTHRWQSAYMQWGRDTMGFGFYVFAVPPISCPMDS